MSHQIIRTEGAEELVILSRADYDALRAAAGDDAAEARAIGRIVRESRAAIERGEEAILPDWLSDALMRGETVVRAARKQAGLTQEDLAMALGISQGYLSEIEKGRKPAPPPLRAKLAVALAIDPGWLAEQ